jgi:hypothetical protein
MFPLYLHDLLEYLKNKVSNFQAGRLSSYVEQWKLLTSDEFILDVVTGAQIELLSTPFQVKCPQKKCLVAKKGWLLILRCYCTQCY